MPNCWRRPGPFHGNLEASPKTSADLPGNRSLLRSDAIHTRSQAILRAGKNANPTTPKCSVFSETVDGETDPPEPSTQRRGVQERVFNARTRLARILMRAARRGASGPEFSSRAMTIGWRPGTVWPPQQPTDERQKRGGHGRPRQVEARRELEI